MGERRPDGSGDEDLSETQFTKLDWRPGKRRRTQPRVRCYAGQKEAPTDLLTATKLVGLDTDRAARCTAMARSTGKTCRRVALKDAGFCLRHGGAKFAMKLRPYMPTEAGQRALAMRALGESRPDRRKRPK